MTWFPEQEPGALTSEEETIGARSQASVAVARPVAAGAVEALHSTVTLAGQEMTGAVLSTTLIVCTQDE